MRTARDFWEAALGELQLQVSRPNFDTWLKDTVGVSYQNDCFIIGAPNRFVAEWLEQRLYSLIKKILSCLTGKSIDIQFIVQSVANTEAELTHPTKDGSYPPRYALQADGGVSTKTPKQFKLNSLNSRYTFGSFVVGETNRLAYAAALEVSEKPGVSYNPLYIYADTSLGKTHLLHAIGNAASEAGYRPLYTGAERLTNEFVVALKNHQIEEFQIKYRSADILLVDDFQFLSGKTQTQECFANIFNDLHNKNCQIVITGDSPPREITSMKKKLISRLEWGLIADIKPPDMETRLAILRAKSKQCDIKISQEVFELIANQFRQNIRELEGGLIRVVTYAKLSGIDLDAKVAVSALESLIENGAKRRISLSSQRVIESVARHYDLSYEAITSRKRDKKTAMARHVTMYILREKNHYSLTEIGKLLGGRDHSTILHGCEKITEEQKTNPQTKEAIQAILKEIETSLVS